MKIIGNREALELAQKKFGERAMVARSGRLFLICAPINRPGFLVIGCVRGEGKSWSEALQNAGIEIPAPVLGTPNMDQPEAENHKEVEE